MDTRLTQLTKIGNQRNPVEETEYQNLMGAAGGAKDPYGEAQSLLGSQAGALSAFNQQQTGQQNDFLNRYKGAIAGQETVPAMAERIGNSLGLPQLQANSQALQNTLFNLPSTYSKATTGRDVNANQLARIIGQKQSELAPAASLAAQNVGTAQSNLSQQLGYGVQQQQKDLIPYQTEQSLLSDQMAREFSGFTKQQENALSLVMQKIQNNQALTMQELQNANALALKKLDYDQQIGLLDKQNQSGSNDKRYITLADGATLYDTQTGQIVSSNQKDFIATGGGAVAGNYYGSTPSYFTPVK